MSFSVALVKFYWFGINWHVFYLNQNAEIAACISLFRKSRHKPNLESTFKHGFPLDLGGKSRGVLSMRMQVILDSLSPGGKKGEFRDWTNTNVIPVPKEASPSQPTGPKHKEQVA